ncbi:hypothetical protein DNK59_06585 [Pseudomonas sp. TKO26]|nr:hypothetical protein DNK62_06585 [Pseudomonas sp. TKO30]PYY92841.1 hypothetical protein DNK61_06585 [Pseudomonas sp. TKO29]PYY95205.1 hypothetical protein DNK59_06585 [Pseudomonas sp. TKO26]PYZ01290.1 hypothetical protein DNK60_06585 [Pseudomonas sp. TKO14]
MGWSTRGRQFATVEGFTLQLCRLAIKEDEEQAGKTDELQGWVKRCLICRENAPPAGQEIPGRAGNQKGVFSSKLLVG